MKHLAWVHENCLFVKESNRRAWEFLDSIGDRWDFGPWVKIAGPTPAIGLYDIVLIRKTRVNDSEDIRPALVTRDLGNGMFQVSPITSQLGLSSAKSSPKDFPIGMDHPDVGTTSMYKPSIISDMPISVNRANMKWIGHLSGDMLNEYLEHTGKPHPGTSAPRPAVSRPKALVPVRPDTYDPFRDPKNFGVVKPATPAQAPVPQPMGAK